MATAGVQRPRIGLLMLGLAELGGGGGTERYFADLIGRRRALVLACVAKGTAFAVLAVADGYADFVVFELIAAGRILNLHLADWLRDTQDLRFDRGMPGDGVIDIAGFIGHVRATGFTGPLEFEVFSGRDWWRRDPDETTAEIVRRYGALTATS